ncbi:head GIN domain-containing protein [Mariniflexile ostreae]|uniref:Head GIN domain-containing protein n=1 Tax=Mariniflexile ostreae TaxID=1520892 RepID=A0ABV5FCB1_9FLAO
MKKIIYIFFLTLLWGCDSEHAGDCFQKAGHLVQSEVDVDFFDKIVVNRNVELVLKEGANQKVSIETGKNLFNDVEVKVVNGVLELTDNNTCNYVRDYSATKVYVTAPNITEIRSSSQYDVSSDGVLTYPNLKILSEDFFAPGFFTIGDFKLQIDNTNFDIIFNNISACYVSGKTENLNIGFYAGTPSRFEGADLIAQHVTIYTRASNDIIVNPQSELKGTITGTGDVFSVTMPPLVDVEVLYKGQLIFK